jgi:hypothetical protein
MVSRNLGNGEVKLEKVCQICRRQRRGTTAVELASHANLAGRQNIKRIHSYAPRNSRVGLKVTHPRKGESCVYYDYYGIKYRYVGAAVKLLPQQRF